MPKVIKRTLFIDPWDQAKHDRGGDQEYEDAKDKILDEIQEEVDENLENEIKKAVSNSPKKSKEIADQVLNSLDHDFNDDDKFIGNNNASEDGKWVKFNSLNIPRMYRCYKNTPHRPESTFLKYAIHRIENRDKYTNATPEERNQMDDDFLNFHQTGGAANKNGHLVREDLKRFLKNKGHSTIKNLLDYQRKIHKYLKSHYPESIKNALGKETLPLTRGLNSDIHGKDHALASYADIPQTGFGTKMFHYHVPLDNIWHSFDIGPESASSEKYGPENEWLVSPHDRIPAQEKDIKHIVPRRSYGFEDHMTDEQRLNWKKFIGKHIKPSDEDLDKLLDSWEIEPIHSQVKTDNVNKNHLMKAIGRFPDNYKMMKAIIENPKFDSELAHTMLNHPKVDSSNKSEILKNSDKVSEEDLMSHIMGTGENNARSALKNNKINKDHVKQALSSHIPEVRHDAIIHYLFDKSMLDEHINKETDKQNIHQLIMSQHFNDEHLETLLNNRGNIGRFGWEKLASKAKKPEHIDRILDTALKDTSSHTDTIAELAVNPNIKDSHLSKIINYGHPYINQKILENNPTLDQKHLLNMAKQLSAITWFGGHLGKHPNINKDIEEALINSKNRYAITAMAGNPQVSEDTKHKLAFNENSSLQTLINLAQTSRNPHTINTLAHNNKEEIAKGCLLNPASNADTVKICREHHSPVVKGLSLAHKDATKEDIDWGLSHENNVIRGYAAANCKTPEQVDKALDDENHWIKEDVFKSKTNKLNSNHIMRGIRSGSWSLADAALKRPEVTVEHLDEASKLNDNTIHERIMKHPLHTRKHTENALNHEHYDSQMAAFKHSPHITEDDIEKAKDNPVGGVSKKAIEHPNATLKNVKSYLKHKDPYVKQAAISKYEKMLNPEKLAASECEINDLEKGSLQSKNPFNPWKEGADTTTQQRKWTASSGKKYTKDDRDSIHPMSNAARLRALNKLSAKTDVRRHPTTGERLFLLHRGMGDHERQFHKNGVGNYEPGTRTSWTPNFDIADDFCDLGHNPVSAWIPESHLIHSVNQFNAPKAKGYKQDQLEKREDEWIVEHNGPILHATKKIEKSEKLEKMSQPTITFPNFKKLTTRPDQQVKIVNPNKIIRRKRDIQDIIYGEPTTISQKNLEIKKLGQKAANLGVSRQMMETDLKTNLSWRPKSGVNVGKGINQPYAFTEGTKGQYRSQEDMGANLDANVQHEAQHYLFQTIENRFSKTHREGLVNKLTSFLHPEDVHNLKKFLVQAAGYNSMSPRINEEILGYTRNILSNKLNREDYEKAKELPDFKYVLGDLDYNRMKTGWKNLTKYAKGLKGKEFHELTQHVDIPFHENNYPQSKPIPEKLAASECEINDLEKGAVDKTIKTLALGTAMSGGLMGISRLEHKYTNPHDDERSRDSASEPTSTDHHDAIIDKGVKEAQKNTYNILRDALVDKSNLRLSPIVAKETVNSHPDLADQYGYIKKLSQKSLSETLNSHPTMHHDIGVRHYDKLYKVFKGDLDKIHCAWKYGIHHTLNKICE